MPELEDITYSRDATIAAVTDYYQFLTRMYMKDSHIIYPPAEGWPSIVNADPETLRALGKSDEVIALLAHLPYIRRTGNWDRDAEAIPYCYFADWQYLIARLCDPTWHTTAEHLRLFTEGCDFDNLSSPHVVGLTDAGRDDPVMILDTERGIVHWEEPDWKIRIEHFQEQIYYDPPEDTPQAEADWRCEPAWSVPYFFGHVLQSQFTSLYWIPISQQSVRPTAGSKLPEDVDMVHRVREIYRQSGWPDDEGYDKDECLEAVRNALAEEYPDHTCGRKGSDD
ncbi:uncharacterized protein E0L32_007842 [Thyridium curvatum]|uniref:Uncharacterized protein n=1 Tax=Thyridium curvatum TaxID=1093900 RepID=A0A507AUL4_9PEZI|nr:uncharacterized protein E0L32_007842 [Thyridium curvatum]TPX11423.1 hypothetical protein E0L32_007842 [Thyridium curvatum]